MTLTPFDVAQSLTLAEIRRASATVDQWGTTWCEVSPGIGFRKLGTHWHFGAIAEPRSLVAVTVPATRMVLDRWAEAHADLTPPHGIPRRRSHLQVVR
jgi:hypothetical protein